MQNDILKVLVTKEELEEICERLGKQISQDYKGKKVILVSVLRGAVVFFADLMRHIDCDCEIDFMAVSSYHGGTKSSGVVTFKKDLDIDIKGQHVLIVEDILDSGLTLHYLIDVLKMREPASMKVCTLLDKPANRRAKISADYVGTVIPDEFVVGYGLDYAERYRNLPYVGVLKKAVYEK